MTASKIPVENQVTVLYTVLTGKAREAAASMNTSGMYIDTFVKELKRKLLYDQNIQQRKLNRWNATTFLQFRNKSHNMHSAVTSCIDFIFQHHKHLPDFIRNDQCLL